MLNLKPGENNIIDIYKAAYRQRIGLKYQAKTPSLIPNKIEIFFDTIKTNRILNGERLLDYSEILEKRKKAALEDKFLSSANEISLNINLNNGCVKGRYSTRLRNQLNNRQKKWFKNLEIYRQESDSEFCETLKINKLSKKRRSSCPDTSKIGIPKEKQNRRSYSKSKSNSNSLKSKKEISIKMQKFLEVEKPTKWISCLSDDQLILSNKTKSRRSKKVRQINSCKGIRRKVGRPKKKLTSSLSVSPHKTKLPFKSVAEQKILFPPNLDQIKPPPFPYPI